MSIQGDLVTLSGLEREIKTLNKRLKLLRKEKRECEARIATYIRAKELPGVKQRGTAVLLEEKTRRAPKTSKERDQDAREVLQRAGVHNADAVLQELLEARKGQAYLSDKLKTKKYRDSQF